MIIEKKLSTLDQTLITGLRHDMLRFASLQLRDDAQAEDVVQESLAAAITGEKDFAGQSAFKTWVFAILKNKIIDVIRQRSRSINITSISTDEANMDDDFDKLFKANAHWTPDNRPREWGDPEHALREQQFMTVLEACLKHLPENTARVYMMRELLELEINDVCSELSISSSNCHVILHRARNGLRLCLERNWLGSGEHPC